MLLRTRGSTFQSCLFYILQCFWPLASFWSVKKPESRRILTAVQQSNSRCPCNLCLLLHKPSHQIHSSSQHTRTHAHTHILTANAAHTLSLSCCLISYLCLHTICRHVNPEYLWVYTAHTSKQPKQFCTQTASIPQNTIWLHTWYFNAKIITGCRCTRIIFFSITSKGETTQFCGFCCLVMLCARTGGKMAPYLPKRALHR